MCGCVRSDTHTVAFCSTSPASNLLGEQPSPRSASLRWVDWAVRARSHRVICLVAGIWMLNGFDLILTILAQEQGLLQEENPFGRYMLRYGTASVVLFKVGLVLIGSYPLLRFRTARITELAAVFILVTYAMLAVHWSHCYELYALAATCVEPTAYLSSAAFATP